MVHGVLKSQTFLTSRLSLPWTAQNIVAVTYCSFNIEIKHTTYSPCPVYPFVRFVFLCISLMPPLKKIQLLSLV